MTDDDKNLKTLEHLWAKVLGMKTVGPDGNFFALGGHSLLAVRLIAAVQEKMDIGSELQLSDLSEFPTPAAFAAHLKSLAEAGGEWVDI